jgi:CheY-like chemotaxis protein
VTGLASPEERRRIRRAGFDSYLAKPVGADLVVDRIARLRARKVAACPPSRRVLVLDDRRKESAELVLLLHELGQAVHATHDPAEALCEASRFEPHLILARAHAELDAASLAERLAASGIRADLVGLLDDDPEAGQKGFDLTLTQPLDPTALDRVLRFADL